MNRSTLIRGASFAAAFLLTTVVGIALPARANAQEFPTQPVKLVAPYPAGGVLDSVSRLLADKLGALWKQPVLVDNRTGAGGMIGADIVVKAPPDGYTLLIASTAEVAINQSLYKHMPYVPERDLAPVTLAATTPLILVAAPGLQVSTIAELADLAHKRSKPISYASAGTGGVQHMAGALLAHHLKLGFIHIPYRGAAPAMVDLLSGQVDVMIQSVPLVMPYIKAGKLVPIAVTATTRLPILPNVPTFNEALKTTDFEISNWYALFAPAKTPEPLLKRLNNDAVGALNLPDLREKLIAAGADPVGNTREEFQKFWKAEIAKYNRLIKISGASVD